MIVHWDATGEAEQKSIVLFQTDSRNWHQKNLRRSLLLPWNVKCRNRGDCGRLVFGLW